jgi:hypothetical protein
MKLEMLLVIVLFNLLFATLALAGPQSAIKASGTYVSMNGKCTAVLEQSPMGGFLQLYIRAGHGHRTHIADDITGVMWMNGDSLFYSASPVYGVPGIFSVTCNHKQKVNTLVSPRNISKIYPNGADYFELRTIEDKKIEYYYARDVDKIDFTHLHSHKNLRSVKLP